MKLTVPSSGSMTQVLPEAPVCSDPSSASSESSGRSPRRRRTISSSAARSASVTMSVGDDFERCPVGRALARSVPASRAMSTASARSVAASPPEPPAVAPAPAPARESAVGTAEEGQNDLAVRVVDVGVHQGDRLPRAERHTAPEHGQGQGRGDERREQVIGAVAGGPVVVDVAVVPGKQEAEAVPEVLLAAGAKLHHHQTGGGVGDAHVQEAVGLSPDEGRHLLGDVDDGAATSGVETKPGGFHPGSLRASLGGTAEVTDRSWGPRSEPRWLGTAT